MPGFIEVYNGKIIYTVNARDSNKDTVFAVTINNTMLIDAGFSGADLLTAGRKGVQFTIRAINGKGETLENKKGEVTVKVNMLPANKYNHPKTKVDKKSTTLTTVTAKK